MSNVEDAPGFEHVPPGMYVAKVAEINEKESKSGNGAMLEIILQPTTDTKGKKLKPKDKKKQIARVYTYVLLEHEPSEWKLKEFISAFGLKPKGELKTDKLIGKSVQVNLKPDTDLDDNYRPRVGKLLKLADQPEPDEPEDDDEDDAGDDDESAIYSEDELNELSTADLKEVAEENELDIPAGKMTAAKKKKLVAAILEAQEEEDDDEEDDDSEEEDDDEEGYTWAELVEMDLDELKEVIEEEELEVKTTKGAGKKKKDRPEDDIRADIAEALDIEVEEEEESDDDDEDEESEDEAVDYNAWAMEDLKKEAKERGLSVKGSKKVLAGRLTKDDEDDEPF